MATLWIILRRSMEYLKGDFQILQEWSDLLELSSLSERKQFMLISSKQKLICSYLLPH